MPVTPPPLDQATWKVVRDPRSVELLMNPERLRYLVPFIGRAMTANDAAALLNVPVTTLQYWVRKFVALGLLEVVREQPRAGKPTRWYQAGGQGMYLPFDAMRAGDLERFIQQWQATWETYLLRNLVRSIADHPQLQGLRFFRNAQGKFRISYSGPDALLLDYSGAHEPALVPGTWLDVLHLTFEEAKHLQRELLRLRARQDQPGHGQRYGLQVRLVPITDPVEPVPRD